MAFYRAKVITYFPSKPIQATLSSSVSLLKRGNWTVEPNSRARTRFCDARFMLHGKATMNGGLSSSPWGDALVHALAVHVKSTHTPPLLARNRVHSWASISHIEAILRRDHAGSRGGHCKQCEVAFYHTCRLLLFSPRNEHRPNLGPPPHYLLHSIIPSLCVCTKRVPVTNLISVVVSMFKVDLRR